MLALLAGGIDGGEIARRGPSPSVHAAWRLPRLG
jgi:hypothetical protein